jgi:hypothetical protein
MSKIEATCGLAVLAGGCWIAAWLSWGFAPIGSVMCVAASLVPLMALGDIWRGK